MDTVLKGMPSPSAIFSTYASYSASMMIIRSMVNDLLPHPVRAYLFSAFRCLFKARSNNLTLIIEELMVMGRNPVYDASETYLSTKISNKADRLKISKNPKEKGLNIRFDQGEVIIDSYQGIDFTWKFICRSKGENSGGNNAASNGKNQSTPEKLFELSFEKKHKEKALNLYIPFVLDKAEKIKEKEKPVKLCSLKSNGYHGSAWESVNLEHPATFDTLAMDHDLKKSIIDDLDMFVRRREFYKRVGRAWKRGYLLYGPPGTGKSSLIAAMANYLKFDVFDLQLESRFHDSDLRRILLMTTNKSILVIEDVDCSVGIQDLRRTRVNETSTKTDVQMTLSGLLNFIDGLWSSCGDERIIIFTTNHKERLDPALLRPGRMDMHIHMSYCTPQGFNILAYNYLGIKAHGKFFGEIEDLLESAKITPAQVAEELMKSEDVEAALTGLVRALKRKVTENDQVENEAKRQKIESKEELATTATSGVIEKKSEETV